MLFDRSCDGFTLFQQRLVFDIVLEFKGMKIDIVLGYGSCTASRLCERLWLRNYNTFCYTQSWLTTLSTYSHNYQPSVWSWALLPVFADGSQ